MSSLLQCHGCRHFVWASLESDRCSAFPDGIPDAIWLGTHDHALPFPGDGGVRREPPPPGSVSPAEARHHAWSLRRVERFAHSNDPLGAIVIALDASSPGSPEVPLDEATLATAWRTTEDGPATLLVMLRARRSRELVFALGLARAQLDAEACDYPHDKGWLGVNLTLASYPTQASVSDARDSAWYGDYLWAKDGSTRVRIFAEDEPERFTLQADLVDAGEPGDDWFPRTRAVATETFLPALEATHVVPTPPEAD